jgi:hypothetical protein
MYTEAGLASEIPYGTRDAAVPRAHSLRRESDEQGDAPAFVLCQNCV